jgi:hypothetical protein
MLNRGMGGGQIYLAAVKDCETYERCGRRYNMAFKLGVPGVEWERVARLTSRRNNIGRSNASDVGLNFCSKAKCH